MTSVIANKVRDYTPGTPSHLSLYMGDFICSCGHTEKLYGYHSEKITVKHICSTLIGSKTHDI